MSQITINIGTAANDGTGDPLRTAFNDVNLNFNEVYAAGPVGSNIQIANNRIITTNTNGNLILSPNGIAKVVSNVDVVPNSANTHSLGAATRRWNTVYGQYLDFTKDVTIGGNVAITGNLTAGNIQYTGNVFVGDLEGSVFDGASSVVLDVIDSAIYVDNYYYANGTPVTFGGNYANANAVAYGQAGWAGNIIPSGNAVYSLGNATNQWNDLYVSNATIFMNNVPISLSSANVLTVNSQPVLINNSGTSITTTGNITADFFIGDGSQLSNVGSANTGNIGFDNYNIYNTQGGGIIVSNFNYLTEEAETAWIEIPPGNSSALLRIVQEQGNVGVVANSQVWTFGADGNVIIPGGILGTTTVVIDNRGTGNTADIQLYSADDILLQARDRTLGDDIEGGDINIYAGDGSPDDAGGGTGSGGDIQIIGGVGGAADVSSGGSGGFVRLDAGNGGDGSAAARAGSGATAYLSAGSGGVDNGSGGNNGGDVVVTAGDTTDVAQDRGSIILNAGAGGNASTLGGYVQVNIPSVGTNPGGQWTFTGSGTTLETPANAEIFGPNFGNLTVGSAGNTIITSADYGFTTYNWVFDNAGGIVAPNLTVTRGDRTGTLTGSTLRIGNGSQEAILTTPNGVDGSDSQRLVINPGAGSEFGEGGDIYLYSGRGGSSGGSGGDIKIRGGLGPADGAGGYIDIVGGEAAGNGVGGYIDILGGQSANSTGGHVRIYGGQGITGGDANITGGVSTAGPGGPVNITGGTSSNGLPEYGNVNITSGASTWNFNNTGTLIVPGEGVIRSINDTIELQSYDTTGNISRGFYVGTGGGLYFKQGTDPNWLTIVPNASNAEISSRSDLTLTSGIGTSGAAGNNISITAGAADQSDYYTTPGGNVNITGGLGATNDGGGGGQGGFVNITSGDSADPAGVPGNVTVNAGSSTWTFDYNNKLSSGPLSITSQYGLGTTGTILENGGTLELIGNGTGGGTTGCVIVGWNSSYGTAGNVAQMYFNPADSTGNIVVTTGNTAGTSYEWNFSKTGNLTAPGSIVTASGSGGNISGANVITANVFSASGNITGANLIATANVLGNGYARFTGTFDESQASTAGLYLGYAGGTPRMMFGTGNTLQTFEIDNDAGNLRFYQPGSTKATLTPSGVFIANVTVTTPTALSSLTAVAGARAFVNNGNLVAAGNFGAQIGGGGSNVVPVWSDGTNWYIG